MNFAENNLYQTSILYFSVLFLAIMSNFEMLKQQLLCKIYLNFRKIWSRPLKLGLYLQYHDLVFFTWVIIKTLATVLSTDVFNRAPVVTNFMMVNTEVLAKHFKITE